MWLLNQVWNLWKQPEFKKISKKKERKLSYSKKIDTYVELFKILDKSFYLRYCIDEQLFNLFDNPISENGYRKFDRRR